MKKSILLIVFVTVVLIGKAQIWCTQGSMWTYNSSDGLQPSILTQTYVKDTLVGGINYNKLHLIDLETGTTFSTTINAYTFTQSNIVLFNSPNPTLITNPIDTLIYFGTIGSKWHPRLRYGGNCAKSFIQITDTGTTNIQGQFLKWRKINYKNYYTFNNGTMDSTTASGIDTIFERIGFKNIYFLYNHCSDLGYIAPTTFRCFQDNQISENATTQACVYTTGILNLSNNSLIFSIYPNPTSSTLNIVDEQNQLLNSTIDITNYLGQHVFSEPFSHQIDVSHFSSGVYTITIKTINGELYYTKFVKE